MPDQKDRLTADRLNDDGVVLLICAIFGYYDRCELAHECDKEEAMAQIFGGGCKVGNSHNDYYQLELNMSRLALKKYTGL